jgi:transcriptional regulator with XRE-family HTH domain
MAVSISKLVSDVGIIPNMARDVAMRLRHARKLAGLTQEELAKAAGVQQAAISQLETGATRSFRGTTLMSIAQSLNVSPEWLASGKGAMQAADTPLPPEAVQHAREWLKLAPEVRARVHDMVIEMNRTSHADRKAVPDERVEEAYGRPGRQPSKHKTK